MMSKTKLKKKIRDSKLLSSSKKQLLLARLETMSPLQQEGLLSILNQENVMIKQSAKEKVLGLTRLKDLKLIKKLTKFLHKSSGRLNKFHQRIARKIVSRNFVS